MFTIGQLDRHVTHERQTADDTAGPVVLVNIFHVEPEDSEDLMQVWAGIIRRFKSQPGYISAQFHRGTAGSGTFLNYSVWESVAHYAAVYNDPAFRAALPDYPDGAVATPHLFRKVALPGVCVS